MDQSIMLSYGLCLVHALQFRRESRTILTSFYSLYLITPSLKSFLKSINLREEGGKSPSLFLSNLTNQILCYKCQLPPKKQVTKHLAAIKLW